MSAVNGGRKRVFVGDVQGCADELEDLLRALDFEPARHELWFAGDLVNRGPKSLEALRRARELGEGSVLGNHDLHLLRVAVGVRETRDGDTFDDVLAAPDREELLAWLRVQPLVRQWDDVVLVHAGLHPRWTDPRAVAAPLEASIASGEIPRDPDLDFLVSVRHCTVDGERPRDDRAPGPGFEPWDHHYRGDRIAVCGHWAARGLVLTERMRAIDTGCVWGGMLTAWVAEDDRVVSVPAREIYREPR